jgi:protein-S-isoprenylcysteine O-methyltransferase Ste14
MITIAFGAACLLLFVTAALTAGMLLERAPAAAVAAQLSRVMHFLFFFCLGLPFVLAGVYPGWGALDGLVGLAALGTPLLRIPAGLLLGLGGLWLMRLAGQALQRVGHGAQAFTLTDTVVREGIFGWTRNPMSLGWYLAALGLSLLIGSQLLVWYVLCGIIPAHLLFLAGFERRELMLRFGDAYADYSRQVPFLLPRRPTGGR